jgi:hypothetical protein
MHGRFLVKLLPVLCLFTLLVRNSLAQPLPGRDASNLTAARLTDGTSPVGTLLDADGTPVRSSQARTVPSDRDYYQFLVDAGGFADAEPGYVCFSDDSRSGGFFTFSAYAYDADYDHAQSELFTLQEKVDAGFGVTPEEKAQLDIMAARQSGAPYVNLVMTGLLQSLSPDVQGRFLSGGRILEMTDYEKGVKGGTIEFLWTGDSWLLQLVPKDPHARVQTSKTFSLKIEPATMRYALSGTASGNGGRGQAAATREYDGETGVCERVAESR